MTFFWPYLLWLLALVPILFALYFWVLRKRRKAALRYASLRLVKEALEGGPGFRRHLPALLFLLGITFMIFALSRPAATVTVPSQRGTIILAIDISGSMRATDVEPSRMAAAQSAARSFVAGQPRNVRTGVVAFAGTSSVAQAPTDSKDDVLAAIDRFRLQRGTAVGSGILSSLDAIFEGLDTPLELTPTNRGTPLGRLEDINAPEIEPMPPGTYRSAIVILITDGQTTQGPDPIQAAQLAADLGVRIFTVGLGTPEGEIIGFGGRSFRVILDEPTLIEIADITDGEYFKATSETDLRDIYQNLSTQLLMETEETEITAFVVAFATALMLAAASLSLLWFGKVM